MEGIPLKEAGGGYWSKLEQMNDEIVIQFILLKKQKNHC